MALYQRSKFICFKIFSVAIPDAAEDLRIVGLSRMTYGKMKFAGT